MRGSISKAGGYASPGIAGCWARPWCGGWLKRIAGSCRWAGKHSICVIRPRSSPGSANIVPDVVFVAAATVGGIYANDRQPADFLYDNLAIAANVIEAARRSEVRKLVFFGTSCMYPKLAAQPIVENSLLEGPLEPTNEWYGVA